MSHVPRCMCICAVRGRRGRCRCDDDEYENHAAALERFQRWSFWDQNEINNNNILWDDLCGWAFAFKLFDLRSNEEIHRPCLCPCRNDAARFCLHVRRYWLLWISFECIEAHGEILPLVLSHSKRARDILNNIFVCRLSLSARFDHLLRDRDG